MAIMENGHHGTQFCLYAIVFFSVRIVDVIITHKGEGFVFHDRVVNAYRMQCDHVGCIEVFVNFC